MKAVEIDSNRNPIIKNGKFQFIYDVDVIKQNCDQAMRQQIGELNYSADKGIDYFGNVFTGTPNFQRFEAQARTQLLNVTGVTGINSFDYELVVSQKENVLEYEVSISTIYGDTTITDSYEETTTQAEIAQITLASLAVTRWVNAGANYATRFEV